MDAQAAENLKRKDYPPSYEVGKPPFCDADQSFCGPGYVFTDKSGSGCVSGYKGTCRFELDEWRKSAAYREVVYRKGRQFAEDNIPSKFYEYGTAPFCAASFCDAILAGKYPIGSLKGACWTGMKTIAIDAFADFQFEKIARFESKCLISKDESSKLWTEFWRATAETAKLAATAIAK